MRKTESHAGTTIDSAISNAIAEAAQFNETVQFDFNGVAVEVAGDSNPDLIRRDWERGMLRPSNTFAVKPYPDVTVSDSELQVDARLIQEREQRSQQRQREYDEKQKAKTAKIEFLLSNANPLALRDETMWQSWVDANSDGYGAAIMRYAEKWGRLMQVGMSTAANMAPTDWIAANADECSHVADDEGLTGFMYGAAVSMLSQAWVYGEELRRWHNLKTQIKDEGERANESGGVLNPAMMTVG